MPECAIESESPLRDPKKRAPRGRWAAGAAISAHARAAFARHHRFPGRASQHAWGARARRRGLLPISASGFSSLLRRRAGVVARGKRRGAATASGRLAPPGRAFAAVAHRGHELAATQGHCNLCHRPHWQAVGTRPCRRNSDVTRRVGEGHCYSEPTTACRLSRQSWWLAFA